MSLGKRSQFGRNAAGNVAIEFAILAPVFFLLLLGQMEVGFNLFQQHRMDDATAGLSRSIQIGNAQSRNLETEQDLREAICPALGSSFRCERVMINVAVSNDWGAAFDPRLWAHTPLSRVDRPSAYCLASAGEYMFLRLSYPQASFTASLLPEAFYTAFDGERVVMLQSYAALRVEPVGARRTGRGCPT